MSERLACCAIIGAMLALGACASTERSPPDAATRGEALAAASCGGCHAIAEGASPNPDAPAFAALANRPDMSRTALAVLLRTPHRTMPDLIVPADEVDDLAAYLATLRG